MGKLIHLLILLLPISVCGQTHIEYSFDAGSKPTYVSDDVTASEVLATGVQTIATNPAFITTGYTIKNDFNRHLSFTIAPAPRHVLRLTSLSLDLKLIKKTIHDQDIVFDVRFGNTGNGQSLQKITIESIPNQNEYQISTTLTLPVRSFGEVTAPLTFYFYTNALASDVLEIDNISISGLTPLPVELVAFTGTSDKGLNNLRWVTATEKNSKDFEVQRSLDSKSFSKAGTVKAAGNSTVKKTYTFSEANKAPITYYRLKAIDLDGSFKYSRVVAVKSPETNIIKVVNPSGSVVSVYSGYKGVKLEIFDGSGKTLRTYELKQGQNNVNTGLANGIYPARYTFGHLILKAGKLLIHQ